MREDQFSDEPDDDEESGDDDETTGEAGELPRATHVFFENEPLIRALNDPRRAENDADAAQRLFRGLLDATLIALVPEETNLSIDDDGQLVGDLQLGFLTVRHEDIAGDIIPMFTDEGALSDFTPSGGRYVALAVRDLFPLLAGEGLPPNVVINPGGGEALLLTPTMVLDLVQSIRGYRPVAVTPGTDVSVTLPDEPIDADTARPIGDVLQAHAHVVACWHFMWQIEGVHDEPTNVLAVRLDEELDETDRRATFETIQDGVEPLVATFGTSVDLVDFARHEELFDGLAETTEPLYQRVDQ